MQQEPNIARKGNQPTIMLALTPSECELIELALGQLLAGARREEHLIPEIRALLDKLRAAEPAA